MVPDEIVMIPELKKKKKAGYGWGATLWNGPFSVLRLILKDAIVSGVLIS